MEPESILKQSNELWGWKSKEVRDKANDPEEK